MSALQFRLFNWPGHAPAIASWLWSDEKKVGSIHFLMDQRDAKYLASKMNAADGTGLVGMAASLPAESDERRSVPLVGTYTASLIYLLGKLADTPYRLDLTSEPELIGMLSPCADHTTEATLFWRDAEGFQVEVVSTRIDFERLGAELARCLDRDAIRQVEQNAWRLMQRTGPTFAPVRVRGTPAHILCLAFGLKIVTEPTKTEIN